MKRAATPPPVVIDLGKRPSDDVKDLRNGRGPLMDDVREALDELNTAGAISNGVPPVILVVQKKPKAAVWQTWM